MIEHDRTDLLSLIDRFFDEDRSQALVGEIEGLILECFRDEDWADDALEALSLYLPDGGRNYVGEAQIGDVLGSIAIELGCPGSDRSRFGEVRRWLDLFAHRSALPPDGEDVTAVLARGYRRINRADRAEIDVVINSSLLGDDELRRSRALGVVAANRLCGSLPALRQLADRADLGESDGAASTRAEVHRVLSLLEANGCC